MLHAAFELLYAVFAAKMSEYTEEDFDLNAGFTQSISVAIVKTVPLLSLLIHIALLGAIVYANTVNSSAVITCVRICATCSCTRHQLAYFILFSHLQSTAMTTTGAYSALGTSAPMYWYVFLLVWIVFTIIGFNVRQNFSLNGTRARAFALFHVDQKFMLPHCFCWSPEWLYSPAEEIARNGNVIDWDCPNLRFRRDPVRPCTPRR